MTVHVPLSSASRLSTFERIAAPDEFRFIEHGVGRHVELQDHELKKAGVGLLVARLLRRSVEPKFHPPHPESPIPPTSPTGAEKPDLNPVSPPSLMNCRSVRVRKT